MGALKITIQQFYRPNGDSTQNRGVLADIELPSLSTHLDVGEADLDYPLAFRPRGAPSRSSKFDEVNPTVVNELRRLSAQRCAASQKFQKVVRNIDHYQQQKAKKAVTLNEAKFLKERAELNADKEEEKAIEKMQGLLRHRARLLFGRGAEHHFGLHEPNTGGQGGLIGQGRLPDGPLTRHLCRVRPLGQDRIDSRDHRSGLKRDS